MAGATCWRQPTSFLPLGLLLLSFASGPAGLALPGRSDRHGFWPLRGRLCDRGRSLWPEARNAITGITLFAGFASTVGWPTSALFIEHFGWRGACLAWAALHLRASGCRLNRLLYRKRRRSRRATGTAVAPSGIPWTMIVLAAVFGATWFVATALPRICRACWKHRCDAGDGGLCRVAGRPGPGRGRLAEFTLLRKASPMILARLATGLHPTGAALLAIFGPIAAVPFVLLHGAGNGMLTIARGTLPLALFGPAGYGLRTGILSAPARILQGGAPLLFGSCSTGRGLAGRSC